MLPKYYQKKPYNLKKEQKYVIIIILIFERSAVSMKLATQEMVELYKECKISKYFSNPETEDFTIRKFYNDTINYNGETFLIKCRIGDSDIRSYKKRQRIY